MPKLTSPLGHPRQEQPPMSVARRANVGEEQLERLLAQASGGNNTSLVEKV
jgi:hypothetical protein